MSDELTPEDYNGIPDNAPPAFKALGEQWALASAGQKTELSLLQEICVPVVTKERLMGQIWLEALARSNNGAIKVKAMELYAKLAGWLEEAPSDDLDKENESTDIKPERVKAVKAAWDANY